MMLFLVLIVTAFGSLLVIGLGFWVGGWLRKHYAYLVGASSSPGPKSSRARFSDQSSRKTRLDRNELTEADVLCLRVWITNPKD